MAISFSDDGGWKLLVEKVARRGRGKTGTSSPGQCAALVSLDDAWRTAFNHRVVNIGAEYKWHCDETHVLDDSRMTLKSCEVGAPKTWVYVPSTDSTWSQVVVKEEEWKALMHVSTET